MRVTKKLKRKIQKKWKAMTMMTTRIGGGEEMDDDEEEEDDDEVKAKKDEEMEELEKEYMNLRNKEDILKNLKHHKDEVFLKVQAVKNQALWDRPLEFRFSLQKVFSSSNKLPQEPIRSSFRGSDSAVDKVYSDLITSSKQTLDCLLELQEALLEKNPSTIQTQYGSTKEFKRTEKLTNSDAENDEEWSRIQQLHCRTVPFRKRRRLQLVQLASKGSCKLLTRILVNK